MLGADVNLQLREHGSAQFVFGKHAANGFGENQLGFLGLAVFSADRALARVAGVPGVFLLFPLLAGEADFFDVHYDDKIAGVDVRGIDGAVLAHQDRGNFARQSTNDFFASVDEQPFLLDGTGLGHVGFHLCASNLRAVPVHSNLMASAGRLSRIPQFTGRGPGQQGWKFWRFGAVGRWLPPTVREGAADR